ncbi:hypothetical protein [Mastigocladopsis repens]|uniref:hypothetical protein n=1 Tax=Mastigocladopsis repens TaxID=221287 RepID=UPI000474DA71|nr:hypothetical protein [Mastigocladopsis repens]
MYTVRMPRKSRGREETKATYRLLSSVKDGIVRTAQLAGRSENLQAEHLLKLGLLAIAGIDPTRFTPQEIEEAFNNLYGEEE